MCSELRIALRGTAVFLHGPVRFFFVVMQGVYVCSLLGFRCLEKTGPSCDASVLMLR